MREQSTSPQEGQWYFRRTTKEKFYVDLVDGKITYCRRQDGTYLCVSTQEFDGGFSKVETPSL